MRKRDLSYNLEGTFLEKENVVKMYGCPLFEIFIAIKDEENSNCLGFELHEIVQVKI